MIDGLFGALFGAPVCVSPAAQQNATDQQLRQSQVVYANANASFLTWNTMAVPPGIYWRQTGGRTWRVTIQR
ncbi:MAG TPA: hypothetical protein VNW90_17150 [Acetobacteraceae bacterium]|nr:hypothetical protein [Acetobacteraceae bacterium]